MEWLLSVKKGGFLGQRCKSTPKNGVYMGWNIIFRPKKGCLLHRSPNRRFLIGLFIFLYCPLVEIITMDTPAKEENLNVSVEERRTNSCDD